MISHRNRLMNFIVDVLPSFMNPGIQHKKTSLNEHKTMSCVTDRSHNFIVSLVTVVTVN